MDGLSQDEIGAKAKRMRRVSLPLHDRNRQWRVLRRRIAYALEQQGRILLVIAIDDDGVKGLFLYLVRGG